MPEVDQYAGISDAERTVIQAFYGGVWAPQVFLGILVFGPIILGVIANIIALAVLGTAWNTTFAWIVIIAGWIFSFIYWVRAFQSATSKPWIKLTYSISKTQWWDNEFMLISWKIIGLVNDERKVGDMEVPQSWGSVVMELTFDNQYLPKMILIAKAELEKLCSFRGSYSVVVHKNLIFEVSDVTHLAVVRPPLGFTRDDIYPFIPICVPTDSSLMVQEICEKAEITIPDIKELTATGSQSYDGHYASMYAQLYKGEHALKEILEEGRKSLRDEIAGQTGQTLKDIGIADEDMTPRRLPKITGRRMVTIAIIGFLLIAILAALRVI